jgi:hypothetical protein
MALGEARRSEGTTLMMLDAFADSGLAFTPLFDTGLASWHYEVYFTWWDPPMGSSTRSASNASLRRCTRRLAPIK